MFSMTDNKLHSANEVKPKANTFLTFPSTVCNIFNNTLTCSAISSSIGTFTLHNQGDESTSQLISSTSTAQHCSLNGAFQCRSIVPVHNSCRRWWRSAYALLVVSIFIWDNCIGAVDALPESCTLCEKNEFYEEYLFDHMVTRHHAIGSLQNLSDSYFTGESVEKICLTVSCTDSVNKYCLGDYFIKDHCWCDRGHSIESLPFVPHICYVNDKYTPEVGTCFYYARIRDCCCGPALARKFRYLTGSGSAACCSVRWLSAILLLLLRSFYYKVAPIH